MYNILLQVLMYMGPDVLKEVIENAELYPIRGLFNFSNYFNEIDSYYHRTSGYEFGASTGWRALNDLYNVSISPVLFSGGKMKRVEKIPQAEFGKHHFHKNRQQEYYLDWN